MGKPAWHATDLSAAQRQSVVVKFLTEAGPVRPTLVEGEVDDSALRPQCPQRVMQAFRPCAGLKDKVRATVLRAMMPTRLGVLPGLRLCHSRQSERFRLFAPPGGWFGND